MPRNFIHKTYDDWITETINRFNCKPIITKKTKNGYEFGFEGVDSDIHGWMSNENLIVGFFMENEMIDLLFDLDICPTKVNGDYSCECCRLAYKTGYVQNEAIKCSSRRELYIKHSLEPFLQWANDSLKQTNRLCLRARNDDPTDFNAAFIKSIDDINTEEYSLILPIVTHIK